MKRVDAYAVLNREIESWKEMEVVELVEGIRLSPFTRIVRVSDEDIEVEVWLRWTDDLHGSIRIDAIANGPSHWRLERLTESVVVRIDVESQASDKPVS